MKIGTISWFSLILRLARWLTSTQQIAVFGIKRIPFPGYLNRDGISRRHGQWFCALQTPDGGRRLVTYCNSGTTSVISRGVDVIKLQATSGDDVNSAATRWRPGGFEWSKIKHDTVTGNMSRNTHLWSYKKKEDISNIASKLVFYLLSQQTLIWMYVNLICS